MHQVAFPNIFDVFDDMLCTQTKALSQQESGEDLRIDKLRQKQFML